MKFSKISVIFALFGFKFLSVLSVHVYKVKDIVKDHYFFSMRSSSATIERNCLKFVLRTRNELHLRPVFGFSDRCRGLGNRALLTVLLGQPLYMFSLHGPIINIFFFLISCEVTFKHSVLSVIKKF